MAGLVIDTHPAVRARRRNSSAPNAGNTALPRPAMRGEGAVVTISTMKIIEVVVARVMVDRRRNGTRAVFRLVCNGG